MNAKQSKKWGKGTIAIPAPIEVDGFMRKVPRGKVTTINEIRSAVAKKHKATIGFVIASFLITGFIAIDQQYAYKHWDRFKEVINYQPQIQR